MKDVESIARERQTINQAIRRFFTQRGYIEVETPIVVRSPGMEPNLTPFETKVIEPNDDTHNAGLITSPEYSMKKLLGAGMQKIFTLTKVFRNEESLGGHHNPEFSMLEWYQQGEDYQACMSETEELIRYVANALDKPIGDEMFEKVRLEEVFAELGLNLAQASIEELRSSCGEHNIQTQDDDTESDLFYRLYLEKIEPSFKDRKLFIYDYPKYQASLAALTPDGNFGQRFECFINGLELCNGFTELTDADEQRARFKEEAEERKGLGKKVFPIDEALLSLLPSIQSPTYGNALGIDRLHMVLTGRTRIQDVLLFPGEELFK